MTFHGLPPNSVLTHVLQVNLDLLAASLIFFLHLFWTRTFGDKHSRFCAGWMLPNKQCQSTES